jgi:hypothetical protein
MRCIFSLVLLISLSGYSQYQNYIIGVKGDTLNIVDKNGKKQGKWVSRIESVRGEPGYEEEGTYENGRKEGQWRMFNLTGDLLGIENYHWGLKDGQAQYYNMMGNLLREESWRALNPDKVYDTLDVEDVMSPGNFKTVVVKNEGASLKHGEWRYYDPSSGFIAKQEFYRLGKLETNGQPSTLKSDTVSLVKKQAKPKEVLDFEKKNAGKKKVRVRDGSTGH